MTHDEKIDALIAAGDKATQGEWVPHRYSASTLLEKDQQGTSICSCSFSGDEDRDQALADAYFIQQAANSREAIKQLKAERDALREVIELLAIGHPDAPKMMQKLLKKGENDE